MTLKEFEKIQFDAQALREAFSAMAPFWYDKDNKEVIDYVAFWLCVSEDEQMVDVHLHERDCRVCRSKRKKSNRVWLLWFVLSCFFITVFTILVFKDSPLGMFFGLLGILLAFIVWFVCLFVHAVKEIKREQEERIRAYKERQKNQKESESNESWRV